MHAHWIEDDEPIGAEQLVAQGLTYQQMATDPEAHRTPLEALMAAHGYVNRDQVALSPETPNLEAICAKFWDEHHHTEDEVRFVLEGEGIFDIRSLDDRWMRVTVVPGDLLIVPKDRNHRFKLSVNQSIRCVRLFKDPAGWQAVYRTDAAQGS